MDKIEKLKELKSLFDQGAITREEFHMLKKDIILKSDGGISPQENNITQPSQQRDSGSKSTIVTKRKNQQNVSARKNKHRRKPKIETNNEISEWSGIWMALGGVTAFILGVVFGIRYESFLVTTIIWGLSYAIPYIILHLLRVRTSKTLLLFLLFAFYVFLIAVPIGNVKPYYPDNANSSYSPSSSMQTHTCSYCGKTYSGYGYHHLFDDCVLNTVHYSSNMCSRKCCMESWNASHR